MRNSSLEIFLNTICRWLPGRDGVVQNITLARCCHCLVYRNCKSFSPGPRSNTNLSSAVSDIWQQWCSPIIWRTGRGKVEFWIDIVSYIVSMFGMERWTLERTIFEEGPHILSRRHYIINGHLNKFLNQIL